MKVLRRLLVNVRLALRQRALEDLDCNARLLDAERHRLRGAIADDRLVLCHINHPIAADGCDPHQ